MSDTPRRSTEKPNDAATSAPSGGPPPERPRGTLDPADAARIAGAALGAGRVGLRAAWRRGKEAAAARGITEESVRQTVEQGRSVAAEQVRRRGLERSGLPRWPGDLSGSPEDRRGSESSAAGRPQQGNPGSGTGATARRSLTRAVAASALSRVPAAAGRRRFGVVPVAAADSAPVERRLGAFALDLGAFGAAFVVLAVALDVLLGAAFGGAGSSGDVLGVSFVELLRVAAFLELGDVATASAPAAVAAVQLLHLLGFAVYMVGLEARFGATFGKRALGLRVVTKARGRGRIGLQRAAIRNACRLYDVLIPLWPLALLDLGITLLSPRRQRSGDWFAGTVVIDERARR